MHTKRAPAQGHGTRTLEQLPTSGSREAAAGAGAAAGVGGGNRPAAKVCRPWAQRIKVSDMSSAIAYHLSQQAVLHTIPAQAQLLTVFML
jgi:hypothetical protein